MSDRHKSTRVSHTHSDNREMERGELTKHLTESHGWTVAMLTLGRTKGDDGLAYMRNWHTQDHR